MLGIQGCSGIFASKSTFLDKTNKKSDNLFKNSIIIGLTFCISAVSIVSLSALRHTHLAIWQYDERVLPPGKIKFFEQYFDYYFLSLTLTLINESNSKDDI